MITEITRQLSFEDIKSKQKIRYKQILDRLCSGNKTAKEIAVELYELGYIPSTERNYTAPRLTELESMGYVKVVDKRKCQYTGKQVAVYKMTQAGLEAANMEHITRLD
jgi:signal recognition particle subunit SEC65